MDSIGNRTNVNLFSRLVLDPRRCEGVPCFSDPVTTSCLCNPDVPDDKGQTGAGNRLGNPVCYIYHVCHCYFGARLGIGLEPNEPYDFNKALTFNKALSWQQLSEGVVRRLQGEPLDNDHLVEQSQEDVRLQQEELVEKAKEKPKTKEKAKSAPKKSEARTPVVAKDGFKEHLLGMGIKHGSMGFVILDFLRESGGATAPQISEKVLEKGYKQVNKIAQTLKDFESNQTLKLEGDRYQITF